MAGDQVTILWVDDAAVMPADVRESSLRDVDHQDVRPAELEAAILRARVRGAVIVIGAHLKVDDVIALGADEAVAATAISPGDETIANAIRNGRTRAAVRFAEAESIAGQELANLVLLSAALGHEINNPLSVATANCEVLAELVLPVTDAVDRIVERAGSTGEINQSDLKRLLNLAENESFVEIRGALDDLSVALQSLKHLVRQMDALTQADAPEIKR